MTSGRRLDYRISHTEFYKSITETFNKISNTDLEETVTIEGRASIISRISFQNLQNEKEDINHALLACT